MSNIRKLVFLTPISVMFVLLILVSLSLSQGNIKANETENAPDIASQTISEASSIFYTGLILGSLIFLELVLVIQVIRRRKKIKAAFEQQFLEEKQRLEIRSLLLSKLDLLLDRYNETAEIVKDSRMNMESHLLSEGEINS